MVHLSCLHLFFVRVVRVVNQCPKLHANMRSGAVPRLARPAHSAAPPSSTHRYSLPLLTLHPPRWTHSPLQLNRRGKGTNASQTISRRGRVHCRSQAQLLPPAVAHAVPPRCLPTAGHSDTSYHPANAWQRCDRCRTRQRLPQPPVPSLLLWRPVCTTPRITNAATAAAAVVVDAEGRFGSWASPQWTCQVPCWAGRGAGHLLHLAVRRAQQPRG